MIEKVTAAGEAKLIEMAHPDPYNSPTNPGGSKYQRYPNNGLGFSPEVCRIPDFIK